MDLSELFVSHKQVDNVNFDESVAPSNSTMWGDLARVRSLLQQMSTPLPEPELPEVVYDKSSIPGVYSWVVASEKEDYDGDSPTNLGWKVKFGTKTEPIDNTSVSNAAVSATNLNRTFNTTSRSGSVIPLPEQTTTQSSTTPAKSTQQTTRKYESLAKKRRSSHYTTFKQELDKFISQNPEYSDIADQLDYLAALESAYQKEVPNKGGSSALGWFQFLDSTRTGLGNTQSREDFAKDAQSQLKLAASYYRSLQNQVRRWGGDPTDFATMYGAWWNPASAKQFITDPTYDLTTKYGESLSMVRQKAIDLLA